MFEEIEKANDGREMILAPQNHPLMFLGFVWDTTAGAQEEAPADSRMADAPADAVVADA